MIDSCLIVGAGLAGLTAAEVLTSHGIDVQVVETGTRVGGRMATTRIVSDGLTAVFDHGAQFFTARSPEFQSAVARWQEAGIVEEWFHGSTKVLADGSIHNEHDGHPRFCAGGGMAAIPEFLARDLNIHRHNTVIEIKHDNKWTLRTDKEKLLRADALILTPPVPQSLALLDTSNLSLEPLVRANLEAIEYDPCLAALLRLPAESRLPGSGALYFEGEPVGWMADNSRKGISPVPGAVTIHAAPQFSRDYWEAEPQVIVEKLQAVAAVWLTGPLQAFTVQRWRYAKPVQPRHDGFVAIPGTNLIFAGDAFAGAKVEGAYRSGLAAAHYLLEERGRSAKLFGLP